eukprot:1723848-Pleurochrysis_carterae.AAC.2
MPACILTASRRRASSTPRWRSLAPSEAGTTAAHSIGCSSIPYLGGGLKRFTFCVYFVCRRAPLLPQWCRPQPNIACLFALVVLLRRLRAHSSAT